MKVCEEDSRDVSQCEKPNHSRNVCAASPGHRRRGLLRRRGPIGGHHRVADAARSSAASRLQRRRNQPEKVVFVYCWSFVVVVVVVVVMWLFSFCWSLSVQWHGDMVSAWRIASSPGKPLCTDDPATNWERKRLRMKKKNRGKPVGQHESQVPKRCAHSAGTAVIRTRDDVFKAKIYWIHRSKILVIDQVKSIVEHELIAS